MKSGAVAFLLILAAAVFRPAMAQDADRIPYFSSQDVEKAIARALSAVGEAKCGKDPCPPATTEEFVTPPVGVEEARLALMTGAKSARLRWCGLEWDKRAYALMMQGFQSRGIHNLRTLTLLQIIHNQQFSRDYPNLQALKTCDERLRASLDAENPIVELPPWQRTVNNALLDQSVADMLRRVLNEIQNARCGDEPCAPSTEEEKANPPVSVEDARRAMKVGLMAGVAEFCGLDWQNRIFLPFMVHYRRTMKMSARQLAIIGTLHGTMQGFMLENYKKRGEPCTDDLRRNLEKHLSSG